MQQHNMLLFFPSDSFLNCVTILKLFSLKLLNIKPGTDEVSRCEGHHKLPPTQTRVSYILRYYADVWMMQRTCNVIQHIADVPEEKVFVVAQTNCLHCQSW